LRTGLKRLLDEEATEDRWYTPPPTHTHTLGVSGFFFLFLAADATDAGRGVVLPLHVSGLPGELGRRRGRCATRTAGGRCPGLEDTELSLPSHHLRCIWMKVCPMHVYIRQYQSFGVGGGAGRRWLRYCATSRKVGGSIRDGVIGPMADSASNRNEYQEYFVGVKAAGAQG
jgi:hypothetical protein